MLTEVLLSLLTRPSSLFRHVVDQVFTTLAPHLTLDALNMILEVSAPICINSRLSVRILPLRLKAKFLSFTFVVQSLDPRKEDQGETLEIVDESGV